MSRSAYSCRVTQCKTSSVTHSDPNTLQRKVDLVWNTRHMTFIQGQFNSVNVQWSGFPLRCFIYRLLSHTKSPKPFLRCVAVLMWMRLELLAPFIKISNDAFNFNTFNKRQFEIKYLRDATVLFPACYISQVVRCLFVFLGPLQPCFSLLVLRTDSHTCSFLDANGKSQMCILMKLEDGYFNFRNKRGQNRTPSASAIISYQCNYFKCLITVIWLL